MSAERVAEMTSLETHQHFFGRDPELAEWSELEREFGGVHALLEALPHAANLVQADLFTLLSQTGENFWNLLQQGMVNLKPKLLERKAGVVIAEAAGTPIVDITRPEVTAASVGIIGYVATKDVAGQKEAKASAGETLAQFIQGARQFALELELALTRELMRIDEQLATTDKSWNKSAQIVQDGGQSAEVSPLLDKFKPKVTEGVQRLRDQYIATKHAFETVHQLFKPFLGKVNSTLENYATESVSPTALKFAPAA